MPHTHSTPPGARCRYSIKMQNSPTYSEREIVLMLDNLDRPGMRLLAELVLEEKDLYNDNEFESLGYWMNGMWRMLDFPNDTKDLI